MEPAEALFWASEGDAVRCQLCPHRCSIPEGGTGLCRSRRNVRGKLEASSYGRVCVRDMDPIEKKPIFHYRPGSKVLSLGTFGCNLDCMGCQNVSLVKASGGVPHEVMTPEMVVEEAIERGADGIAWTYNEPITWYEFILETAILSKERGIYTMLNTNGYILPGPARTLFEHVQVANIDVKGFTEDFYLKICGGSLKEVLDTCLLAGSIGVHVELTYLLIPGLNDSVEEVSRFCNWSVREMGADVPVTFFRFRPFHLLSHLPEESMEKMNEAYGIATESGIKYVYFGGVVGDEHQNTYCPRCGALIVERKSVKATGKVCFKGNEVSRFCPSVVDVKVHLVSGRCPNCRELIPIIRMDIPHRKMTSSGP